MEIKVLKNVLIKNNALGSDNRELFSRHNVYAINLVSSPGAGKTTLLENSLDYLTLKYKVGVIEGDLYTDRDAKRLQHFDIPLVQINTEGGCHLDARMVHGAVQNISLPDVDILFIENVGNLVCPAGFDLGENLKVLIYSITEGADKPKKYANIFAAVDVVIVNKIDLLELCRIKIDEVISEIREVNATVKIFTLSANNRLTLTDWHLWLDNRIKSVLKVPGSKIA